MTSLKEKTQCTLFLPVFTSIEVRLDAFIAHVICHFHLLGTNLDHPVEAVDLFISMTSGMNLQQQA